MVFLWLIVFSTVQVSIFNHSYAAEFEIEEVITAIKQDIQTAMMTGIESPNFDIETVYLSLTLVSIVSQKGMLRIKVAGFDREEPNQAINHGGYQKINLNITPNVEHSYLPESTYGLAEPIYKIKSSIRKAHLNPPNFQLDTFTIKLEFAIEKSNNRGFQFNVIDLNDLKAQAVKTHSLTINLKLRK
jgi:hypothetical protein